MDCVRRWPVHPQPRKDELLSSWLQELARYLVVEVFLVENPVAEGPGLIRMLTGPSAIVIAGMPNLGTPVLSSSGWMESFSQYGVSSRNSSVSIAARPSASSGHKKPIVSS